MFLDTAATRDHTALCSLDEGVKDDIPPSIWSYYHDTAVAEVPVAQKYFV